MSLPKERIKVQTSCVGGTLEGGAGYVNPSHCMTKNVFQIQNS